MNRRAFFGKVAAAAIAPKAVHTFTQGGFVTAPASVVSAGASSEKVIALTQIQALHGDAIRRFVSGEEFQSALAECMAFNRGNMRGRFGL